ncbi:MAG: hypothetical protein U0166_19060 [Acidobacteriota bacterium]
MKKFAAICLALAFLMMSAPAMADHLTKLKKTDMMGTVSAMESGKSVTIKDDKGAETQLMWDAETKVMGKDGKAMTAADVKKDGKIKVSVAEVDGKKVAAEVWLQ